MRQSILDIPFPMKGLDTGVPYEAQRPGTTRSALNVRGYEPVTGADRGGQRAGLTKWCPTSLGFPIQDINHLATGIGVPVVNPGDMVVPLSSGGAYKLFSSAAAALGTAGSAGDSLNCACWDASDTCYVGWIDASNNLKVSKVSRTGTVAWTTTLQTSVGSTPHGCFGICWDNSANIYVLGTGASLSPVLRIWKLDTATGTIQGGTYLISETSVAGIRDQSLAQPTLNVLAYCNGYLMYPSAAQQVTLYRISNANKTTISLTAARFGTAFTDICSDLQNFFYVNGYNTTGPHTGLAKINTSGTTLFDVETSVPIYSIAFSSAVQELGGINTTTFKALSLLTGTVLATYTPTGSNWSVVRNSGIGFFDLYANASSNNFVQINAALVPTVALMTLVANVINAGVGVNQQTAAPTLAALNIRVLATAAGYVYRVDGTKAVALPHGQNFSNGTTYIFSSPLFDKLFYCDGLQYAYYDSADDDMHRWNATSGTLPVDGAGNAARLIVTWRQRIVLSGLALDASNWFMSATGNPYDFNYNPATTVETQAVAGNNSTAGVAPDIITCLIPYSDEILLFGQSHSIFQMSGDPMAGGRIDLVADTIGMAFGQPWCRDGQGNLYFMSNMGSVYQYAPGALPQRISDPISEQLVGTIDFSNTLIRLAWDERQSSIHCFISPTGGGATINYTFDTRNGAWWPFSFANTQHQPFAIHSLQGFTATDRNVLVGGQDGYIRHLDPAALDDDGTPINSYVFIGPMKGKAGQPAYLSDLQCGLGSGSGGVNYSVFTGQDAQSALVATSRFTGSFTAGRNRSKPVRALGHAMYVKLASPGSTTWQLDWLRARLTIPEGKTRERVF